jgi:hypothetical protein
MSGKSNEKLVACHPEKRELTQSMSFPIRRVLSVVALVSSMIAVSYFVLFPQVWRCEWVAQSPMHKATDKLYISPLIATKNYSNIQKIIGQAQKRVQHLWKTRQGQPTIIVCGNDDEYRQFCNSIEGAGCSIGTPWNHSFVILNADGLNVDVLAHELCHDELFSRLGWWVTTRQIPQWFNEGLALMTDYRFVSETDSIQRYLDYKDEWLTRSHGQQTMLTLNDISSSRGFFGGGDAHAMLSYMTAGMEVSRWLSISAKSALPQLIESVSAGEDFEATYDGLEQKAVKKMGFHPAKQPAVLR